MAPTTLLVSISRWASAAWLSGIQDRVNFIMDNLIAEKKVKPMIIVMERRAATKAGEKPPLKSFWLVQILIAVALSAFGQPYYIAPAGNDADPGTLRKPFASLQRAQQAVRQKAGNVFLRGGTYY